MLEPTVRARRSGLGMGGVFLDVGLSRLSDFREITEARFAGKKKTDEDC